MFYPIMNSIQLAIMNNESFFQVEYDENDFHSTGGVVNQRATDMDSTKTQP